MLWYRRDASYNDTGRPSSSIPKLHLQSKTYPDLARCTNPGPRRIILMLDPGFGVENPEEFRCCKRCLKKR